MQCAFNIFNSINPPRLALCMIKTFGLVVRIFPERRGAAAYLRWVSWQWHDMSLPCIWWRFTQKHIVTVMCFDDNIPNGAARHDAEKEQRMAKCDSSANLLQWDNVVDTSDDVDGGHGHVRVGGPAAVPPAVPLPNLASNIFRFLNIQIFLAHKHFVGQMFFLRFKCSFGDLNIFGHTQIFSLQAEYFVRLFHAARQTHGFILV